MSEPAATLIEALRDSGTPLELRAAEWIEEAYKYHCLFREAQRAPKGEHRDKLFEKADTAMGNMK